MVACPAFVSACGHTQMTGLNLTSLLLFAGTLAVAAATPGPGVAALVARVLARGRAGAYAFAIGLGLGDIVWLTAAILGLAVLAQTFQALFIAIKFIGAAYLLYMAWKLWRAPARPPTEVDMPAERGWRLFLAGFTISLSNPKVIFFYLALLPGLIDMVNVDMIAFAELIGVIATTLTVIFGCYIALAARARALVTSPRGARLMNRGTGAMMAGAAAAIVVR